MSRNHGCTTSSLAALWRQMDRESATCNVLKCMPISHRMMFLLLLENDEDDIDFELNKDSAGDQER